MNRFFLILSFLIFGLGMLWNAQAEEEVIIENLTLESEVYFQEGLWVGTNGVRVVYGEVVLTADTVQLDEQQGDVRASGNVRLQQGDWIWRGEDLLYNLNTGEIRAGAFRAGRAPFFAAGEGLRLDADRVYSATNAVITADDLQVPFYRVHSRRVRVIPGESLTGTHSVLHLGPVPVFYFPYYKRSLDQASGWRLTPGYRTRHGPYLLSSYNWQLSESLSGAANLDYRQRRGIGLGPDFRYDLGDWGRGDASFYYLRDSRPGEDFTGAPISPDRHRSRFSYQANLRTNLTAKILVNHQSDPEVLRDFFESDFRTDPQPKTFLEVNQLWPNFSLNVLARPQLNDFFQTVERLPDVKLSGARQQLGVSPVFYESETSLAYLRMQPGMPGGMTNYAAFRADTFHQLLLPHTFFGWLNVAPRVGGRLTHYGEAHGPGGVTEEEQRGVFNTGTDVSFKLSRTWPGADSPFWEVDGLRHIAEPSFNYVFVPSPSVSPRDLPQFDREWPSLRLLPVHFPDYNAIDSIDSRNVLRMGLRNRLQTKRKDRIEDLAHWALMTDLRLDPRPGQGSFADLFSDLELRPRSWLALGSEVRYDLDAGSMRLAHHRATISPGDVWSLALGHRYFKPFPELAPEAANNIFFSQLFYRFNENWGVRMSHHFEARDGVLEEQYYTVYRDLRSWTGALTFRVRESRVGPTDYSIAVMFSLKAFPRFGVGRDRAEPSFLLGG